MAGIPVRTLLCIHDDHGQAAPFEVICELAAEMIPGATLKTYPGAPHVTAITHKDRFTADLLVFYERE